MRGPVVTSGLRERSAYRTRLNSGLGMKIIYLFYEVPNNCACLFVYLFVFLALQPIMVVFSQPGSGL
jgi:hypothetical protein